MQELKDASASVVLLLLLIVFFAVVDSKFLRTQNIINILRVASITVLAVYGQTLVLISGKIDLSMGSVAGIVSAVLAMCLQKLPIFPSIVIVLALAALIGLIIGILVFGFNFPAFIITFGMLIGLDGLGSLITNNAPIELISVENFGFLGSGMLLGIPVPLIIAVVCFFIFRFLLSKTYYGRTLYALGNNPTATYLSGRNVRLTGIITFMLSSVLVGATSVVLSSRIYSGLSSISPNLAFDAIAAAALGGISLSGGKGNLLQATTGAVTVTVLMNGLNILNVGTYYQMIAGGMIILFAVVANNIRETGFSTLTGFKFGSLKRKKAAAACEDDAL
jgi:ribose/xylose/arabinose/galactoside ABC-type transport system permease subunit